MIAVRMRDEDLGQRRPVERARERIEMPRVAGARVDERRHPSRHEPRPVAGAGDRAGVEGMNGDRVQ